MQLRLIRNATMVLTYAGHTILTDPYFAPQYSLPTYAGRSLNPLVALPLTPETILTGVEKVIVSHRHTDHFDIVAQKLLPKTLALYCQPFNTHYIRDIGFVAVTPIDDVIDWDSIHITRVGGHHGLGRVEEQMGMVSGFVLQAPGEPTVYWTGDTVLCDSVRATIAHWHPDVIITHSNGAMWTDDAKERVFIVMDAAQTIATALLAPTSQIVAIHMETVDHGTITRADLRAQIEHAGLGAKPIIIPTDGEMLTFT